MKSKVGFLWKKSRCGNGLGEKSNVPIFGFQFLNKFASFRPGQLCCWGVDGWMGGWGGWFPNKNLPKSPRIDMAHYVTESPFFVFGVFTVFVFGIYFSNFFESSILRIWCVWRVWGVILLERITSNFMCYMYMIGGVWKKICHVFDVFSVFDFVGLFQVFGQRMMRLVC